MSYRARQRLRQKDRERRSAPDDVHPRLQDYLNLPYHVMLVRDEEGKGGWQWLTSVDELPGCVARGRTPQEAVSKISNALSDWISTALRENREIPQPKSAESHSGRLHLRMPRTLHAELTRVAERENVSLNQFITDALAAAVGWRTPAANSPDSSARPEVQTLGSVSLHAMDPVPLALKSDDLALMSEEPNTGPRRLNLIAAALIANFVLIAVVGIVVVLGLLAAWR